MRPDREYMRALAKVVVIMSIMALSVAPVVLAVFRSPWWLLCYLAIPLLLADGPEDGDE